MVQESLENSPSNNVASRKDVTKTNSKGVISQNKDVDITVAFNATSPRSTPASDERSQSITVSPDSFPALPLCSKPSSSCKSKACKNQYDDKDSAHDEHEIAEGTTHSHGISRSSVEKDYNFSISTTPALQQELVEKKDPNEFLSPTKDTLPDGGAIDGHDSFINYALETISPSQPLQTPVTEKQSTSLNTIADNDGFINYALENISQNQHLSLQTPVTEKQLISSTVGFNEIPFTPTTYSITHNLNEIQTPSPYLTKSIASHIQTAEKELKQSKSISPYGDNTTPITPSHKGKTPGYVPSSLASYIESAEKEFDDIVKDTLTSPVRTFPTLEMSSMKFQQLSLGREEEEEGKNDEEEAKEVVNTPQCNNAKECYGVQKSMGDGAEKESCSNKKMIVGDNDGKKANNSADRVNIQEDSSESSWQYLGFGRAFINFFGIACRILLFFFFVMGATLFVSGSFTYPAHPLLFPHSSKYKCVKGENYTQCNPSTATYPSSSQKIDASIAAASFGFATTIRTVAMAPLIRLHEKTQQKHSLPQLGFSNLLEHLDYIADKMEQFAHQVWEDIARHSHVLGDETLSPDFSSPSYKHPPELDLSLLVPCQEDALREYLLTRSTSHVSNPYNEHFSKTIDGPNSPCRLRNVITHGILMDYVKVHFDPNFDLATHTLLLRNVWPRQSLLDGDENDSCAPAEADGHSDDEGYCSSRRRLTLKGMMTDPQLSNFILPNHFSDAANTGYAALVPDATTPTTLSQFISNILSGKTPNAKIGTQIIVEQNPELHKEIIPLRIATIFGWQPEMTKERMKKSLGQTIGSWLDRLPAMSYFPVFIAGNKVPDSNDSSKHNQHPRTDLHCEPIGNIAVQLHGTRRWTLIPTKFSGILRPTVSKHGRGYFYSNLNPITELPKRLQSLPVVHEIITSAGDAVWVPPWMWHRVDYDGDNNEHDVRSSSRPKDSLSIGASIFHFYPVLYRTNFPLFALLIVPNLIWEAIGFNME